MRFPPTLASWLAAAAAASLCAVAPAALADWPERPINFVVPSAAGGSPDVLSRVITNELANILKTPVVVDNKPGAAGNIGLLQIINKPADGYTIGYGNVNTLAVNRALFKKLPYDVDRDLVPVAHAFDLYNVLIVRAESPYRSAGALIEAARKNPGKLSFGAPGVGTTGHMSGEVFRSMAKIDVLYVPYNGGPAALQDLLGGRTDFLFANSSEVVPLVTSGKVRALGVTSLQRLALLPNVPTLDESGLKGYQTVAWGGIVAPKNTPKAVVDQLNAAVQTALKAPAVREGLARLGAVPAGGTPEQFKQMIDRETTRWAGIVEAARIEKLD
ncbi:MAG TPA: tripartite tricarboxylate transporter substrate binding protein [Ramlibacter sp.]|jgi:tripartite-type tricarboxylate transporter receptor subunit TctC|uniref:Bug family tripartite tricarboxylate transporter substrate binding protein n=1 Tax=Ramlibacter sp. TaxID=1917967 RepID=UPI002D4E89CF|nr:tripartite tricarboxylate transporter substrate binding protein [Ramlibacter sp.]HZY19621.1 tripartite tricarboxylate transporter substrate binding protein [Ramlibacter sp.]